MTLGCVAAATTHDPRPTTHGPTRPRVSSFLPLVARAEALPRPSERAQILDLAPRRPLRRGAPFPRIGDPGRGVGPGVGALCVDRRLHARNPLHIRVGCPLGLEPSLTSSHLLSPSPTFPLPPSPTSSHLLPPSLSHHLPPSPTISHHLPSRWDVIMDWKLGQIAAGYAPSAASPAHCYYVSKGPPFELSCK